MEICCPLVGVPLCCICGASWEAVRAVPFSACVVRACQHQNVGRHCGTDGHCPGSDLLTWCGGGDTLFVSWSFRDRSDRPREDAMSSAVCLEQRRCLSLLFYRAVRDLKPVWMLEDMRTMLALCPDDEDHSQKTYSPSEALLYAIVHDHQGYAQYLLSHFPEEALVEPGERFCSCSTPAPHLSLAVRYDRHIILGLILQVAHRLPNGPPAVRGGCVRQGDGRTPLHLACELVRPEAVLLLLGSGACPVVPDAQGLTPLDVLLEPLRDCEEAGKERRHCLDTLLMFMPRVHFHLREAMRTEPHRWSGALGHDTVQFLGGFRPAPLLLSAMQTVFKQLSPTTFSDSLLQLPIPSSLKPAGLTCGLPRCSDRTL